MEGRCTHGHLPPAELRHEARVQLATVAAPSGSSSHSLNTLDRSSRPPPADDDSPLLDPDPARPQHLLTALTAAPPLLLLPVAPQSSCATTCLTSLASMGRWSP